MTVGFPKLFISCVVAVNAGSVGVLFALVDIVYLGLSLQLSALNFWVSSFPYSPGVCSDPVSVACLGLLYVVCC